MRIMQWNAGRGLGSTNSTILRKLAVDNECRVCLLQEMVGPNGYGSLEGVHESREWSVFHSGRAAILVGQGVRACVQKKWCRRVGADGAGVDAVAVEVVGMGLRHPVLLVSVYRDATEDVLESLDYLRSLLLQMPSASVVVGGDFNVHATSLGARANREGGDGFDHLVADLEDVGGGCCNTGEATYVGRPVSLRPITPSCIDGTVFRSSDQHPINVCDWRTGGQEHSDHKIIYFTVEECPIPGHVTETFDESGHVTPPSNWFQFKRKAFNENSSARFAVAAEALARGGQGGLDTEPASAFAMRVLGEIQSAAQHAGLVSKWRPRATRATHKVYCWNAEISNAKACLERARKDFLDAKDYELQSYFRGICKQASRDLKQAIEDSRRVDWQSFCSGISVETPVKEVWSRLRRVSKTGKGPRGAATPMMRDPNGHVIASAAAQAQMLTDHWAARSSQSHPTTQAFSRSAKGMVEAEYDRVMGESRDSTPNGHIPEYCQLFNISELDGILNQLPAGKAAGWDGIPYELLTALGPEMRARVLQCLNGLWVSGGVPSEWKEAILIPLAKKESASKVEDFRPVSLLVCLCKVLEALIHRRLEWVLDGRVKLLPPNDLGFRRHATAVQQVVRATQAAHEAWARGEDLAVVMLDVDKAFDTLWGVGLVVKMHRLGVRGRMLQFIDNYLRGRLCRAVIEGEVAASRMWDLGIGQGGILGPLFFVVYFSDLPVLPSSGGKYADDSSVWHVISRSPKSRDQSVGVLQSHLDAIHEWSRVWRMTFSAPKTVVVVLTPIRKRQFMLDNPIQLTMGGTPLTQAMEGGSRLLGIWLDPHLRFDSHFSKVGERAWRRVNVLRSISGTRWGADRTTLTNLYVGWIRPILEYGSYVYMGAAQEELYKLDKIQAAALRIILGCTGTACVESMHWEAGIQHLGTRRLQEAAIVASSLRRTPSAANSCADDFQKWMGSRDSEEAASRLQWADSAMVSYERAGGRMSPFEMLGGAYRLVGMWSHDRDLESKDPVTGGYRDPPWAHPIPLKDRDWPTFKSASKRSKAERAAARAYGSQKLVGAYYNGHVDQKTVIMAFTDGSADPSRGGGGASVVWEGGPLNGRTFSKDVGRIATCFMAEGEALLQAIAMIEEATVGMDPATVRVHIWADCQPAIRLIDEGRTDPKGAYWKLALRARRMLGHYRATGLEVSIDWLPAHCGLPQNELADRKANEAAEEGRSRDSAGNLVYRPHVVIRAAVKSRVRRAEDDWYRTSKMSKRSRDLNQHSRPRDLSHVLREGKLGREFEVCLSRLRVGNETRPSGRMRMGITRSDRCPRCGSADGTEHRILHCRGIARERAQAQNQLVAINFTYKFNIATLIGLWGVRAGDFLKVLKVVKDFFYSVPGLVEGFLETRQRPKERRVLGTAQLEEAPEDPAEPPERIDGLPEEIDLDPPTAREDYDWWATFVLGIDQYGLPEEAPPLRVTGPRSEGVT